MPLAFRPERFVASGDQRLINDYRERPLGASSKTIAEFLAHLLSPMRRMDSGGWDPDVADFFAAPPMIFTADVDS